MCKIHKSILIGLVALAFSANAEETIEYCADALFGVGNGDLAPYYISANRFGKLTQNNNAQLDLGFNRYMDLNKRFTWSYGVEFITGATSSTEYTSRNEQIGNHSERPAAIWLQQLYGEIKYRCLYLSAGMKDRVSPMLNFELSSGDVIQSGNSRSIPQVRMGFIDFQDIPFTKHFLQIQGEFSYGKFMDKKWYENHFNYYTGHYNTNGLYHYKRVYFRTNPQKPFSATFGGQFACLFGGDTHYWNKGKLTKVVKNASDLDAFWQAMLPRDTGTEGYMQGQSLGSWDINLRYRLRNGAQIKGYLQNLWEDGSGMGKLNGLDGLWGLEYVAPQKGIISGAVLEYIQMTNQGGPLHWDPEDEKGTSLSQYQATGGDNYYNNGFYNSYAYFGKSIGSPFSKEPIYNLNGDVTYLNTRVKGFHFGISGNPVENLSYRVLGSWRKSWGTYVKPLLHTQECTSFLLEAKYDVKTIKGLSIKGEFAADFGRLYGNNVGGAVTVSYSGLMNLFNK